MLIVAIILLLLMGTVFWYVNKSVPFPLTQPASVPTPQITSQAQVTITGTGFIPSTISVKKGTQVIWTNTDSSPHQVASDPYPSHSLLPELVSKTLNTKDSYSFVFEKSGTFSYYDETNPLKNKAVVVVKE